MVYMIESISRLDSVKQSSYYTWLRNAYTNLPNDEVDDLFEPVVLAGPEIDRLEATQQLLQVALKALLLNYQSSEDLQSLVPVSTRTLDLLGELEDEPLEGQIVRPDFVYRPNGAPQICEINARFIFNGLYLTVNSANGLSEFGRVPDGTVELEQFLKSKHSGKRSYVIKGREPDYDMFYYKENNDVTVIPPVDEAIDGIEDCDQVVLELHQDELELCLESVVKLIKRGFKVINDPRVIMIGHDKRLLAAMCSPSLMGQFIDPVLAPKLSSCIVPTWVDGWRGSNQLGAALSYPERYVAKLAISGKSDGFYDFRFFDQQDINDIRLISDQVAIQERIEQTRISGSDQSLEVAGTLPMTICEETLGPGVMRFYKYGAPYKFEGYCPVLESPE